MASNLDRYKAHLDRLTKLGDVMAADLAFQRIGEHDKLTSEQREVKDKVRGTFESAYQRWYTESHPVVHQLIPNRLGEFENLYKGDGKRKQVDVTTYNIQDWLMGIRAGEDDSTLEKAFDDLGAVLQRFGTQLAILKSARSRFDSTLFEIRQLLQADIFDSELDAARELLTNGFVRAAGAIAGVVLEGHLREIASNRGLRIRKKTPSIGEYNDSLKEAGVIEVPEWRFNQRLGDLRNLCAHEKGREPSAGEVEELIGGVERVIKSLA